MNKIFLLLLLVACGVQAQIGGSPTGFNYGIKLPNATNEGDTLTVDTKIPIMNNDQVVNYFANVADILALATSVEWGNITGTLSDQTDLQSALNAKQATITGAASTIVSSDLTNNRALISNGSGKVEVSAVTTTELSYVSGVTSALQTQLDAKLNSSTYTSDWSGLTSTDFVRANNTTANSGYLFLNRNGTTVGQYALHVNQEGASANIAVFRKGAPGTTSDATSVIIDASANVISTGTMTATNFILSSDKRLKENFIDLGNGYYSFNLKGEQGKRYGVIAQEVKEYAPELVSEGEDGYLKVAYIDLLIKKQAEQEKRITYLWIVIGVLSLGVGYSILKK